LEKVVLDSPNNSPQTPEWIVTTLCAVFAALWSITALPHTLGIQYVCLIIGAILGLYAVRENSATLTKKVSYIPLLLIGVLFLWVVFHLFCIGQNYALQAKELNVIWKRALLGSLFAIGLGISVVRAKNTRVNWSILGFGLACPTVIFYVKYLSTFALPSIGVDVPPWLVLYRGPAEFYVPKISYVFFCIPCLAVSVGFIVAGVENKTLTLKTFFLLTLLVASILELFYLENIKNGVAYGALIISFGIFKISIMKRSNLLPKLLIILSCALILGVFGIKNIEQNESWRSFYSDLKVAIDTDPFDPRGFILSGIYPINEQGVEVQPANYARFSWGFAAVHLIRDNPLGYGLVHSSFGHLVRERFPKADLDQSHSGWLDMILGLGIPGAGLVLLAATLAIKNAMALAPPWKNFGIWFLGSMVMLWVTTEVSQKNYLNTFIWMIVFVASLSVGMAIHSQAISAPLSK
jgi:hypothetical protein